MQANIIAAIEAFDAWAQPWTLLDDVMARPTLTSADRELVQKVWQEAGDARHWSHGDGARDTGLALQKHFPWLTERARDQLVRAASYEWRRVSAHRQDGKMELKLKRPFHLHLDVLETDDRIPSMHMRVSVGMQQFGHRFDYRGSLWFDCYVWDAFASGLASIEETAAELVDMGGRFVLRLGLESGASLISLRLEHVDMSGAVCVLAHRSLIDLDDLAYVRRQFTQFDRWW